ncbi:MAG: hypothetical protein WD646_07025 [Actinomycetota bacterium]
MPTLEENYYAVRSSGVRIEWPPRPQLVRITGPQRIWFLQNTITTDVETVDVGQWVESFLLEPKGKVFAHFRVGILEDEVWLEVESSATDLAERLESMRFRTKVEIESVPRTHVTVLGVGAPSIGRPGQTTLDPAALSFGGELADVATADLYTEDPGSVTALRKFEVAPSQIYEMLRVEAGVPAFGVDYGTDNLPQEAGLTRAVSVEKGCYIGQETIARVHFRGHINKVVRPLKLADVDPATALGRDLLLAGRKAGRITSAVLSPRNGSIGLGMVGVDAAQDTVLEVDGGGSATVGPIPEGTKVKAN